MGPWDEAALESLIFNWGEAYAISRPEPDLWLAQRRDNRETLQAADSEALVKLIAADYRKKPIAR